MRVDLDVCWEQQTSVITIDAKNASHIYGK